jgi:hypothetical protein
MLRALAGLKPAALASYSGSVSQWIEVWNPFDKLSQGWALLGRSLAAFSGEQLAPPQSAASTTLHTNLLTPQAFSLYHIPDLLLLRYLSLFVALLDIESLQFQRSRKPGDKPKAWRDEPK